MSQKKKKSGFRCFHCHRWVLFSESIGTKYRNHCPLCLWSRHADEEVPGDRKSTCRAEMKPIGLTFKHEGKDKYGKPKQGELMIIQQCVNPSCGKISINRIAGDDSPEAILKVFEESQGFESSLRKRLSKGKIKLLTGKDEKQIHIQLFGLPLSFQYSRRGARACPWALSRVQKEGA